VTYPLLKAESSVVLSQNSIDNVINAKSKVTPDNSFNVNFKTDHLR